MSRFIVRSLALLALLSGLGVPGAVVAQEKVKSHFVVKVPERGFEETTLTVGGQATTQTGTERKFVTPDIEKGATYTYELKAVIVPNNYTHIFRTKKVTFKGGETVKVDMTQETGKENIEVRWVATPNDIVDEMCKMAKVTKNDTVYDLGCGDAVMLIRPIKYFNAKKGVGIDIDPKILEKAKENVKTAGMTDKIDLKVGNILEVTEKDMADADVVLLYIGDDLGKRLGPVLRKALKPGARIVSHRFSLGDWEPTMRRDDVHGEDGGTYNLLMWVIPEKK